MASAADSPRCPHLASELASGRGFKLSLDVGGRNTGKEVVGDLDHVTVASNVAFGLT